MTLIAKLTPFLGILSLIGVPTAIGAMLVHNDKAQAQHDKEFLEQHPGLKPRFDETASRINDLNHPFWTHATLLQTCPTTHEFLYDYRGHKYVGNHDAEHGVVEIDDSVVQNAEQIKVFCH